MELTLKPHSKNTYPLKALLIRSSNVVYWVQELQRMQLALAKIELYPVPGLTANSVGGCLVVLKEGQAVAAGAHEWCQQVHPNVYIAESSLLHPSLTDAELERLFATGKHVIHPEFGFVELTEKVSFASLLQSPKIVSLEITKPQDSVFAPQHIRSFRIQPVSLEETLQKLEAAVGPPHEEFKDKPLSFLEKMKLFFYQLLFLGGLPFAASSTGKSGRMGKFLSKLVSKMQSGTPKWMQSMQQDFEDLEKRNQKFVNKLMDLLKNNPQEALKYAIPLDDSGLGRGSSQAGAMEWTARWFDFSLFGGGGGGSGSGGGSTSIGDQYYELQRQYQETAKQLLEQKEYQKAAFVYMKLLKNYQAAAQALETGRYYQEAAAVYLNYLKDKRKAAECYEKGSMPLEAIELYKELSENEKVGDLYSQLGHKKEADYYYMQAIEKLKLTNQYVKASLLYRHKMDNYTDAQDLLREGWRLEKDAFNCLNNYFANIQDIKQLQQSIESVYQTDVYEANRELFLQILEHEYAKHTDLQQPVREMAYEITAAHWQKNPKVVLQLEKFNPDKQLLKDLMQFSHTQRQK